MSEDGVLEIPEKSLDQLIRHMSKKVVGKSMKRFEIHDNVQVLKNEMRELIYEGFRDLKDLLIASGHGLDMTSFDFKTNKGKTHST